MIGRLLSLLFISLLLLIPATPALDKACPSPSEYQDNCPIKEKNYKSATTCDGQQLIWTQCNSTFPCDITTTRVNYLTQSSPYTFSIVPISVTIFKPTTHFVVNLTCAIPTPTCYYYDNGVEYCPKILWVREHDNGSTEWLPSSDDTNNLRHYFSILKVRMNGTYYCVVNGTVNYNELYSIVSSPATVTFQPYTGYHWSNSIYDSPSVYTNAGDVVKLLVPRGGSVFLDCSTNEPFTERHWIDDGNERVKIISNPVRMQYLCQITQVGVVRTFNLEYYEGPPIQLSSFLASPKSQNVSKGANITLYCLANTTTSDQYLTYTWYSNNSTLTSSSNGHMLVLESIRVSGYYTCLVRDTTSNGSSIQSTAFVRVFDKPSVTINWYISQTTPSPPTITLSGLNDNVLDINLNTTTGGGSSLQNSLNLTQNLLNLTLVCRVNDEDQPLRYRWYFRGDPISRCPSCPILLNETSLFFNYSIPVEDIIGSVQCLVGGVNGWGSSQVRIKIKDKPNPPDNLTLTQLQPNDLFLSNLTFRIMWTPPSTGIRPIGYHVVFTHYYHPCSGGTFSGDTVKSQLQLRTTSTCILYDKFCDTLFLSGHIQFSVSAVGGGEGGGVYSDGVLPTNMSLGLTGLTYLATPKYPLALTNQYTTKPYRRNNKFSVTIHFNSFTSSYGSYFDEYQSNDYLENEYYDYKLNLSCFDEINKTFISDPNYSSTRTMNGHNYTLALQCMLSCSWNVELNKIDKNTGKDNFKQKTVTHYVTTPALYPSQTGVISSVSWNGNTGTDFIIFIKLPPSYILCGLQNITITATCDDTNKLTIHNFNVSSTPLPSSITGSLSDQYCWEQCNVSFTYTNTAGTSRSSNVMSLPPPPQYSNTTELIISNKINLTRINDTAINITWSLKEGIECLIRKDHINNSQTFYWYSGRCSYYNIKRRSYNSANLSLLNNYVIINDEFNSLIMMYCFVLNGHQYNVTTSTLFPSSVTSISTVSPTGSPFTNGYTSSPSSNRIKIIASNVGGAIGVVIFVIIIFVGIFGVCVYIRSKKRRPLFIIQNDSTNEDRVHLLREDEMSMISEKTDYQKLEATKYDEEQMEKFLNSTIDYNTTPSSRDSCSSSTLIEYEPTNKGKMPHRNQPRPFIKKDEKLLQSASLLSLQQPLPRQPLPRQPLPRQPPHLVTVSAIVHDTTSGYCRTIEDMTTAATNLNKTTPTTYIPSQGVELEQFEFTEPGEEEFEITNNNKIQLTPPIITPHLAPPTTTPLVPFGDYVSYSKPPSISRQATPTQIISGQNSRSSELTPTPSTSSSMASLATVGGGGSDNRDSGERKYPRRNYKDRHVKNGRNSRLSSSKSYSRRASNRSSPSSGILSSGGSSDSVFHSSSSSSVAQNDSRLSRSRKSSGFGSAPVTPKSSGPMCSNDTINTQFPFPPPPPLALTGLNNYHSSSTGVPLCPPSTSKFVTQPSAPFTLSSSSYIPSSFTGPNPIETTGTTTGGTSINNYWSASLYGDTSSSSTDSQCNRSKLTNFTYDLQPTSVANTSSSLLTPPALTSSNTSSRYTGNYLQNTTGQHRMNTLAGPSTGRVETGSYLTENSLAIGQESNSNNRRKTSLTPPNVVIGNGDQLATGTFVPESAGYISDTWSPIVPYTWSSKGPSLLGDHHTDNTLLLPSNKPNLSLSLNNNTSTTSSSSSSQVHNSSNFITKPYSPTYLLDHSFLLSPTSTTTPRPINDTSGSSLSSGSTPVNPPITPLSPSLKTPVNQPSTPNNSNYTPTLFKDWKLPVGTLSSTTKSVSESSKMILSPLTTPLKVPPPLAVTPSKSHTPLIDPLSSKLNPNMLSPSNGLPSFPVVTPPKVPQINTPLKSPLDDITPLSLVSHSSSIGGYMTLPTTSTVPHATVNHLISSNTSKKDMVTVSMSPTQSLNCHSNTGHVTTHYTGIPSLLYGHPSKVTPTQSSKVTPTQFNNEPPTHFTRNPPTRSNSEVTDESYSLPDSISSSMKEFFKNDNEILLPDDAHSSSRDPPTRSNSEISYSIPDSMSNSIQDLLNDDEQLLNSSNYISRYNEEEFGPYLGDYIHTVQPNDYISS